MGHYQEKGWNAAVEALWAKANEMYAAIDEGEELDFEHGEELRDLCLAYMKADREMWVQVKQDNDAMDAIDHARRYPKCATAHAAAIGAIREASRGWCLAWLKQEAEFGSLYSDEYRVEMNGGEGLSVEDARELVVSFIRS